MLILVDVAILGLIALFCWRGFRSGLINGICGILAIVIAFYGASMVAEIYSPNFPSVLEPFMSGLVDKSMSTVVTYQEGSKYATRPEIVLAEDEHDDVYAVSHAAYYQLGFSDSVSRKMAEETAQACPEMDQMVIVDMTERVCLRLSYVLTFYVIFALIAIIFSAIGNILDLSFGLPGVEALNHIGGLILGFLRAAALVLIITCIFRYTGMLIPHSDLNGTLLLRFLTEHNLAADLLGI